MDNELRINNFSPNYDNFGRLIWKRKENTPEQNLELGRTNFLGLFYQKYPDFAEQFPLDENGMISEDNREPAKQYLENLVGRGHGRFTISIAPAVNSRKITPYFEGSAEVVLQKSFEPLGIALKEPLLPDTYQIIVNGNLIEAINQSVGANNLLEFFKNQNSELSNQPFVVVKRENNNSRLLNIGYSGSKQITYTLNQEMQDFVEQGGKLAFFPQTSPDKRYSWCDIYPVTEDMSVDLNNPLGSSRLDREKQRISSYDWDGYEIELFSDYLAGIEDINVSELKEFPIRITNSGLINISTHKNTSTNRAISFVLQKGNLQAGQIITCKPKFDSKTGYTWLEGYIDEGEGQKQVFTRRFIKGSTDLGIWQGPQEQSVLDWANGLLSTDKIDKLVFDLDKNKRKLFKAEGQPGILLDFRSVAFRNIKQIEVRLKEDKLYKWMEVFDAKDPNSQVALMSYQVTKQDGEVIIDGTWPGPERKRYIDFLNGTLDFDNLSPMKASIRKNAIYLFTYDTRRAINLLVPLGSFPEHTTEALIVPSLSENNELVVSAVDIESGKTVRRYVWNNERKSFDILDNIKKHSWSHLETLAQWQAEYNKHPEWSGITMTKMFEHDSGEARSFSHNLQIWAVRISNRDIKQRDELITQIIPKSRLDKYVGLKTIEDWASVFHAHPEWQQMSPVQMQKDTQTSGGSFLKSFSMWVLRNAETPEERVALRRALFPNAQPRPLREKLSRIIISPEEAERITLEEAQRIMEEILKQH